MEVWLSVDGGRTFLMCISPWLNPKDKFFDWTVPNMPTNAAVMDIRFGCEVFYPETYAPQPASTFVIAQAPVTYIQQSTLIRFQAYQHYHTSSNEKEIRFSIRLL